MELSVREEWGILGLGSVFDLSAQHDVVDAKIVAALERLSQVFRVRLREEAWERDLSPTQAQF
jgi:hypothetical protein